MQVRSLAVVTFVGLIGWVTPVSRATTVVGLVDFGPNDGGTNGVATGATSSPYVGQDANGRYWNNWIQNGTAFVNPSSGAGSLAIKDTTNTSTIASLSLVTNTTAPGANSAGLLVSGAQYTADASAFATNFGLLSAQSAVEDAIFNTVYNASTTANAANAVTGTEMQLTGLDPSQKYTLTFVATRTSTAAGVRNTTYIVTSGSALNVYTSATVTTSGTGAADSTNGLNDRDLAVFANLTPSSTGIIDYSFYCSNNTASGTFAYLNALSVTVPEPATWSTLLMGLSTLTLRRPRRRR